MVNNFRVYVRYLINFYQIYLRNLNVLVKVLSTRNNEILSINDCKHNNNIKLWYHCYQFATIITNEILNIFNHQKQMQSSYVWSNVFMI